ncbi:MAG: hypothetical protein LBQ12_14195 [Deltaproteobacteria bacterium]|jgi:hypothetical protein|nr:hypothetical protein [Deltaproteobacteria bacterium]
MSYTDRVLGNRARKGSTGPIGGLKGKPTDKMQTSGKPAITGSGGAKSPAKGGKKK